MRLIILAIMLTVSVSPTLSGTENARPEESQKPWKMMQKLAPLAGTWRVERAQTFDGGKSWQQYPATSVAITYSQKGLLLEERSNAVNDDGFHMAIFLSYDQYRNVYRQAAIEDYWGLMDISEGVIKDGNLVLTNTRTKTYYPMEEGRLRALKVTMQLTSPERLVLIDESYDDGKTWSPTFRIRFIRLDG